MNSLFWTLKEQRPHPTVPLRVREFTSHQTRYPMRNIDVRMVPLIQALNQHQNIATIACCQYDPNAWLHTLKARPYETCGRSHHFAAAGPLAYVLTNAKTAEAINAIVQRLHTARVTFELLAMPSAYVYRPGETVMLLMPPRGIRAAAIAIAKPQ